MRLLFRPAPVLLGRWFLIAAALAVTAPGAASQATVVGGHVGRVSSHQTWVTEPPDPDRRGILVGAYADVQTPLPWLQVVVEASFTSRGGGVPVDESSGRFAAAESRVDYLTLPLLLKTGLSAGPVRVFLYGGPAQELELRKRLPASIDATITEERVSVFALFVGGGVSLDLAWGRIYVEARRSQGMGKAFEAGGQPIRHRGVEVLARIGVFRGQTR
jgi:hypothetical protein